MTGCIKRLKLFYFAAYLPSCFSCSLTKSQNLCYCQLYTRYFLPYLPLFSLKALITAWREEKEISKCKISLTVASHGNHKVCLVFSNFSFPKRPEICVLLKKRIYHVWVENANTCPAAWPSNICRCWENVRPQWLL